MNANVEMGVEKRETRTCVAPGPDESVSETVYVGRASFRVARDVNVAPPPAIEEATWLVPGPSHRLATGAEDETVTTTAPPDLEDGSGAFVVRNDPSPKRWSKALAWTLGPVLIVTAFALGMLVSPVARSSLSHHHRPASAVAHAVVQPAPSILPTATATPRVPIAAPPTASASSAALAPLVPIATKGHRSKRRSAAKLDAVDATSPAVPAKRAPIPWIDPWAN